MANLIVTIDGPAASGKSTAARLLAQRLKGVFLDTGAMYRAVTWAALQAGKDLKDESQLLEVLDGSRFEFSIQAGKMTARVNGVDVTGQIRRSDVTANARYIASASKVRERLVKMQRDFSASEEKIVTEGRDQGTVAFPEADVKFYLVAETSERARRRFAELRAQGEVNVHPEEIRKAIEERDRSDTSRGVGPLRPAEDAIMVDTTHLTIEEVVEKLLRYVEGRCSSKD
jgi:cytidylate kinase